MSIKDKKHIQNSQTTGTADLTDNWYVTESLNTASGAYLRREANIFDPLFCGEEAFTKIQNEIKNAKKTVDIVCWGFDPAMPLLRTTKSAEEWPYWSDGEKAKVINKKELVAAAKKKLQELERAESTKKQKQKRGVDAIEEQDAKDKKARESDATAQSEELPEATKDALKESGLKGKIKGLVRKEAKKLLEKAVAETEKQIKKLTGMVTQCQDYLDEKLKVVEGLAYGLAGLDEAYNMVRGSKVLGDETLGQLLIGVATGTNNSAEFSLLGEMLRASEIEAKKGANAEFTTEFFLNIYAEKIGSFRNLTDEQKQTLIDQLPDMVGSVIAAAKGKDRAENQEKKAEGETAENAEGEETKKAEDKGVKVRVLMWYGGWLASLGGNAPGFLQSKVTNVVKEVVSNKVGDILKTKVDTFLDKQKDEVVNALFKGESWPKVISEVTGILDKITNIKDGKYSDIFGTKMDELKDTTTTELGNFSEAVTGLLGNGAKGLKDIAKVASSAGVKRLIDGFTDTAYSPRNYYNQAWFTAAALGKIPNLEIRIRQFDPMLPQQLFGVIFPSKPQLERVKEVEKGKEDEYSESGSKVTEKFALSTFRSHHQKTIVVDYVEPEEARGFLMSHNLNSCYWDTRAHLNKEVDGLREPGAATEPWQDLSCYVKGGCLYDMNKNFCDAWDKAKPADAVGWQSELLSWMPMLTNPKKYLSGELKEVGDAITKHLKTKAKNSALEEILDQHTDKAKDHLKFKDWAWVKIITEDLPSLAKGAWNEAKEILTDLSTPAEPAEPYKAGSLMTERAEITAETLGKALPEKYADVKRSGQIIRTYPISADDTGDQDDSIKLAYFDKLIQRPRAFVYAENQYFQLKEWADKLNFQRSQYDALMAANKKSSLETAISKDSELPKKLPLYIFCITPLQERSAMLQRHHEMFKIWGKNGQLTTTDQKYTKADIPGEATMANENTAKNNDKGADLPPTVGSNSRSDGKEVGKPEDKGANPVEVQICMLKAVERNQKRIDIGGLFSKLGGFGDSVDNLWQTLIKGNDTRTAFSDEEIAQCQEQFDSGDDLAFWQNTIHPSRYYTNIYVHSKLTVVDDAVFTTGSANLNARSMAGDSELNLLSDDDQTAFKFRHTLIDDHTRNWLIDPLKEDSLENSLKKADTKGTLEDDPECQANAACQQKFEANFPKVKAPEEKTLRGIKKAIRTWGALMKDNEKNMMEGSHRANEEGVVVETDHKGILTCQLCRLVDQRSPSWLPLG